MRWGPRPPSPKGAAFLGLSFGFVLGLGFFLLMVDAYFDPEALLEPSWPLALFVCVTGVAFGAVAGTLLWLVGGSWTRAVAAASAGHVVAPFVFAVLLLQVRILAVAFPGYLLTAVLISLSLLRLLRWRNLMVTIAVAVLGAIGFRLSPLFGVAGFAAIHGVLAMIAWAAAANAAARVWRDRAT